MTTPPPPSVVAVGMFDGVHAGHRHLLAHLRALADRLGLRPVVVTFADHPLRVIRPSAAPPLLTSVAVKERLLRAEGVEVVTLSFDSALRRLSAREFMALLRDRFGARMLLLGFNNHFGHDRLTDLDDYRRIGSRLGIDVERAPEWRHDREHRVSSSAIRGLLLDGDVERAADLLGRRYRLTGRVVHGKELGRRLGYPTANVDPDPESLLVPADGVYAAIVTLPDGERRPGMLNIGHRPTVDTPDAPVSVEVHVIGYDGDLYGRRISIDFIKRLRGEHRFDSLDELRDALAADARATMEAFNAAAEETRE